MLFGGQHALRERLDGLHDELAELKVRIADLRAILASPHRIDGIITDELRDLRESHGNPRRTEIAEAADEIVLDRLDEAGVRLGMLVGGARQRQLAGFVVDVVVALARAVDAVGPVQAGVEPLR